MELIWVPLWLSLVLLRAPGLHESRTGLYLAWLQKGKEEEKRKRSLLLVRETRQTGDETGAGRSTDLVPSQSRRLSPSTKTDPGGTLLCRDEPGSNALRGLDERGEGGQKP